MARRKDPRNTEWSLKAASVPKAAQCWCLNRNRDLSDNRATSVSRLRNCSRQLTFYATDINSSSGDWEYHSGSEQTGPKNSLTITQRRNIIAEPLILKKKINTFESSVVHLTTCLHRCGKYDLVSKWRRDKGGGLDPYSEAICASVDGSVRVEEKAGANQYAR